MKKQILTITLLLSTSFLASSQTTFNKNNLGVRPYVINNNGVGIGLNYERYLDSTNNFSLYIPLDYILIITNNSTYNTPYYYGYKEMFGFSFSPSFRIYFKEPRKFNWFVGIGGYYGYGYYSTYNVKNENTSIGSIVNYGFKATIKKKVSVSLDIGTGLTLYYKNIFTDFYQQPNYTKTDSKLRPIGSLNFQVGYNF